MPLPMTFGELVALAGVPEEEAAELRAAGYLDADGDGLCDGADLLRLVTIISLPGSGRLAERAATVDPGGSPLLRRLFGPNLNRHTLGDAAEKVGIPIDELEAMQAGMALKDTLDDFDVESLEAARRMIDAGFPADAMYEGARVYSDAMRRVTDAEVSMAHRFLCQSLGDDLSPQHLMGALFASLGMIEPLADRLLEDALSDHRIRALAAHTLDHLEAAKRGSGAISLELSVVFVDLALFTALTEAEGDEAAASLLDRFDRSVRTAVVPHRGSLVKQIGDAFMLTFPRPEDAVRFALEINERSQDVGDVRIGIHHGPVLHRVGDYVGHTVNLASRVAAMAMADTILVTEVVAKAAADAGIEVESIGVRRTRGAEQPVALYRVVPGTMATDPVCGRPVGAEAAARLRHQGAELVFCSHDCVRAFLATPDRYVAR